MDALFSQSLVPLLEKQAIFAEKRHQALATNVAHVNTPDHRDRDLPVEKFEAAMRAAIASRHAVSASDPQAAHSLSELYDPNPEQHQAEIPSKPPHLDDFFSKQLFQAHEADPGNVTFHDGNNRSIERAVMQMRKNLGQQRLAVELLAAQMNLLQSVISERP